MVNNIKEIKLWEDITQGTKENYNGLRPVKIEFKFPCTWTTLNIEDLKQILRKWIEGEELKYPIEKGFRGRWLLFDVIKEVFDKSQGRCLK